VPIQTANAMAIQLTYVTSQEAGRKTNFPLVLEEERVLEALLSILNRDHPIKHTLQILLKQKMKISKPLLL